MTRKLYKGIDTFKLIAALGVVAIHTEIKFGSLSNPVDEE